MHYLLFYDVVDEYVRRRERFRAEHLEHALAARERGELILAGATGSPPSGAVLLFSGDDPEIPVRFASEDPYVREGLVTSWRVVPWITVVGNDAVAPLPRSEG
jgi:uncharacterized protein